MIFWPKDSKCYTAYSRGPCPHGKLLIEGFNQTAECDVINKNTNIILYNKSLYI